MANVSGFITNLGKYNEGYLVGKWIDFPVAEDEFQAALKEIGCCYTDNEGKRHNAEYEEYFFTDWNNEVPFHFGEYENIADVNDYAERVEALSAYEQEYVKTILEEHTSDAEEALRIVEDGDYMVWYGCDSMADVAERQAEEYCLLNEIPDNLRYYIDFEKWGRDLDIEGTFLEGDGYYLELLH